MATTHMVATEHVLELICYNVRNYGYVRAEDANRTNTKSTLGRVMQDLKLVTNGDPVNVEFQDRGEARAILEWGRNPTYKNNRSSWATRILKARVVPNSLSGIVSLIMAVDEYRSKIVKSPSTYQHSVGDRVALLLECDNVETVPSVYGRSYSVTLKDRNGNEYVWNTAKRLTVGLNYAGKATIKEHKTTNKVNQTVIQRFNCVSIPN